jgi:hypothetical protein
VFWRYAVFVPYAPCAISLRRSLQLQVVREQCWLNGVLETVQWFAEDPDRNAGVNGGPADKEQEEKEMEPTEEELDALLNGPSQPSEMHGGPHSRNISIKAHFNRSRSQ